MFKKRQCSRCGRKIESKYSYCPYCGNHLSSENDEDDWGMLGKDDVMSSINGVKLPMGFNALFNSLIRNLSKEFDEQLSKNYFQTDDKPKKIKRDGISISISTFGNGPPRIKVTQLGEKPKIIQEEVREKLKQNTFTQEKIKKFASLEKQEPKTDVRRLSNRLVYEIEVPGVKSLDDISIIKLENSIEIKSIAKDRAYLKRIPINLPIINYTLSEGKLILELAIKE